MVDVITEASEHAKQFAFDKERETPYNAVVNIQGDEPFIDPEQIDKVVGIMTADNFSIATLAKRIDNQEVKYYYINGGKYAGIYHDQEGAGHDSQGDS